MAISISDDYIGEAFADEPKAALEESDEFEPRISLTISGATKCPGVKDEDENKSSEYCAYGSNLATVGKTTYSDVYGINIEGEDVASYALYIKGENDGKLTGVQNTEMVSAEAENGEELNPGEWGYMLFDSLESAEASLASTKISALTGEDVSIVDSEDDAGTKTEEHNEVDVTRGIAFAANFDKDAPTGHYKSAVTLSLAATPKSLVKGIREGMYMQDITAAMCALTDLNTPITVKDKRDDKDYSIARIKNKAGDTSDDGANCWMTQNLVYDIKKYVDDESHKDDLTPTLSDVSSDKLSWAKSDVTVQLGAYSSDDNAKAVYTNAAPTTTGIGSGTYNSTYGFYYSWCAATAGSCSEATSSTAQPGVRSASESICPAGWKLPTGGSGGQFSGLLGNSSSVAVGTVNYLGAPYNFLLSGNMDTGGFNNGGSFGLYWSSSSQSGTGAYALSMNSSSATPQGSIDRYYGRSVRCVLKNALESAIADAGITTMQDFTASICAKGNLGDTATLTDARDNKQYSIARIKNATNDTAHCWMTSNLAYDIKKYVNDDSHKNDLTSALSDVSSDKLSWARDNVTVQLGAYSSSDNAKAVYTNNTPSVKASGSTNGNYSSTYGYYYSWCAATAGSCSEATSSTAQLGVRSASESICPAGWKLPTGGAGGQFSGLLGNGSSVAVGTVNYLGAPYNFLLSGNMTTSGFINGGSYGSYWSSSSQSGTDAYYLSMGNSAARPQDYSSRYFGLSVRCVVVVD